MDYEKKYKEALERASGFKTAECRDVAEYIFPELKESEDERIRRKLITFFQRFPYTNLYDAGLNAKDVLAWLEKQGEQKLDWNEEDDDYYDAIITKLEVTQDDAALTDNQMEFLKSLKGRVQPKQEWSEEDKRILDALITSLNNERFAGRLEFLKGIKVSLVIDWLKFLKEK